MPAYIPGSIYSDKASTVVRTGQRKYQKCCRCYWLYALENIPLLYFEACQCKSKGGDIVSKTYYSQNNVQRQQSHYADGADCDFGNGEDIHITVEVS